MRAIVVGLGPMGKIWLDTLRRNPQVECAACVEANPETLRRVGDAYGIAAERRFERLEDALRQTEADFLIDVTPPQFHLQVAEAAFAAGLHVLSEKPIAPGFAAAKQWVEAARNSGKTCMISQNYRFHPIPQALKRYIAEGTAGNIAAAEIAYYGGADFGAANFRHTMDYPLVADMSIHHFDLMRCLFGKDAVSVFAHSFNPPWSWYRGDASAMMLIDFGDLLVNYHGTWCGRGKMTSGNGEWRVEGSEGTLIWKDPDLRLVRNRQRDELELPVEEMARTAQDYTLHEFMSALRENRRPECHPDDNIRSFAMASAAIASAERKEKVYLEEFLV